MFDSRPQYGAWGESPQGSFDKAPVRSLGLGGEAERRNRSDFANFPEYMFVF